MGSSLASTPLAIELWIDKGVSILPSVNTIPFAH